MPSFVQRAALALSVLIALGCKREDPPPVPIPDASIFPDASWRDSGPIRRHDSGPSDPIIDGELTDEEWEGATTAEATIETDEPGSELHRLRAILQEHRLVIAVEGTIADGDAIAVYVDRDLGGPDGLESPIALGDTVGTLDVALSRSSLRVPADLRMDFAWGTAAMPHTAAGTDDVIGWREVASDPEHFTSLSSTDGPSVCSDTACEAAIPLEELGGDAPRTIALFARIVRADGGLTNQTLPEDDDTQPEMVSALLTIDDGVMPDGGMPDGGTLDGGAGGIVVDGVIGADEWAGVASLANDVPAFGEFTGESLSTLRAVRESTRLVVAIEGSFSDGHAIVMYVDHDVGGFDGVVSPTPFNDFTGALDRAISKTLFVTDAALRIDAAWGTLDMPGSGSDDRVGWRDVGTNPDMFTVLSGETVCVSGACETAIPLAALGASASADIGLFVRLVDATSDLVSNQTLPEDSGGDPDFVTMYLRLPPP